MSAIALSGMKDLPYESQKMPVEESHIQLLYISDILFLSTEILFFSFFILTLSKLYHGLFTYEAKYPRKILLTGV